MDPGVYSGVISACVVVAILFLVSKKRKVETALVPAPTDLVSFSIYASIADVQNAIYRFAESSNLKVEYGDEYKGLIVLGENIGLLKFHNGFWLFIYLTPAADGATTVQVGIKSKIYQAQFALNIIRNKQTDKLYKSITGQSRQTVK